MLQARLVLGTLNNTPRRRLQLNDVIFFIHQSKNLLVQLVPEYFATNKSLDSRDGFRFIQQFPTYPQLLLPMNIPSTTRLKVDNHRFFIQQRVLDILHGPACLHTSETGLKLDD